MAGPTPQIQREAWEKIDVIGAKLLRDFKVNQLNYVITGKLNKDLSPVEKLLKADLKRYLDGVSQFVTLSKGFVVPALKTGYRNMEDTDSPRAGMAFPLLALLFDLMSRAAYKGLVSDDEMVTILKSLDDMYVDVFKMHEEKFWKHERDALAKRPTMDFSLSGKRSIQPAASVLGDNNPLNVNEISTWNWPGTRF